MKAVCRILHSLPTFPLGYCQCGGRFRFRQGSSMFYVQNSANLGGQIFEGLLYRKGAIVKNWKFRWFLLSTTQREESSDPAVCTGSMSVLLVMSNLCILVLGLTCIALLSLLCKSNEWKHIHLYHILSLY